LKRRHSQDDVPIQSQDQLVQPKLEPCDSSYGEHRLDETPVEIKTERTENNDNNQNKFSSPNPPNDCMSNSKPSGQAHDRINNPNHNSNNNSHSNNSAICSDQSSFLSSSDMKIKEETKDEDFACFVIDSDEEENYMDGLSDNSRSNPLPPDASFSEVTNWSSDAGLSAFANNDPNMMNQFGQFQGDPSKWENFDMSQIPGGSNMNNDGSAPFNPMDPNQRNSVICHLCKKVYSRINLRRHIRDVHLKMKRFSCPLCPCSFPQKTHLEKHAARKHNISNDNISQLDTSVHGCVSSMQEDIHSNQFETPYQRSAPK